MFKRVLAVVVMFLVSVVLTNGGTGVSHAAGEKDTSKTKPAQSKEKKETFDAHDTAFATILETRIWISTSAHSFLAPR